MRFYICNGKHHVTICKGKSQEPARDAKNKDGDQYIHVGAAHTAQTGTDITLTSAIITVQGRLGCQRVRALFDTGSQRTFVTKKLAMGLGLKPTSKRFLSVSTFGTKKSSRSEFDVVSLTLSKGAGKIEVSALVISISNYL